MHPTPTWAVYRDAETGHLVRKYIAAGEAKRRYYGVREAANSNISPAEIASDTTTCSGASP